MTLPRSMSGSRSAPQREAMRPQSPDSCSAPLSSDDVFIDATYVPPPYQPPRTIGELLGELWRQVVLTPGRAALATADVLALIVVVLAARTVSVSGVDAHGPFRARCGVSYYLFGHPNSLVRQTCRSAYASHAGPLFTAGSLVVVATTMLVLTIISSSRPPGRIRQFGAHATATPTRAALATISVSALAVGLAWLRTVPVQGHDSYGPFTAHCGLGYYLFGNESSIVRADCRRAFESHIEVLILCATLFFAGAVVLTGLIVSNRVVSESGKRLRVPDRSSEDGASL